MKNIFKAFVGLLLILVYHVPLLGYRLLLVSYAYVFNHQENLTADPKVHLKRAKKLLRGDNSKLLYAALELRFALERMAQRELIFSDKAPNKAIKEYNPLKKVKALRRLDERTKHPHKIFYVNPETGEQVELGQYKPMDEVRVSQMQGKLGDLLHPKDGLLLGVSDDAWYIQTRAFLSESLNYLSTVIADNTPYFSYEGRDNFKFIKNDA